METRRELYAAIKAAIGSVDKVKHIDLWNHNVEFIEEEAGWDRPAVFVEFGTISWHPYVGGGYRGEGSVRLHIVTDWIEGGQEMAWALTARIREVMEAVDGKGFYDIRLTETLTNHNHEDILESIECYGFRCTILV